MAVSPRSRDVGAQLRTTSAPWARITATHADGASVETRSDGQGRAVLSGLPAGRWTVSAQDVRRGLCSGAVAVTVDPVDPVDTVAGAPATPLDLRPTIVTSRLLVGVRGSDRRAVLASEVLVTDASGRTVAGKLHGGLADVRGLRPGPVRVVVPASVGHLGTTREIDLGPGVLAAVDAVVPVGASIAGRVVQDGRQYAAVVTLLDADGVEVERVRTDEAGRFLLGTGLATSEGLTVVATTGPETLHVTRAAVADVCVVTGVRHDLGDVVLPVAGRRAVWSARSPAVAGMQLPSTRV